MPGEIPSIKRERSASPDDVIDGPTRVSMRLAARGLELRRDELDPDTVMCEHCKKPFKKIESLHKHYFYCSLVGCFGRARGGRGRQDYLVGFCAAPV